MSDASQQPVPAPKPKKGLAIASMILGIVSILASANPGAIVLGILAIVFFAIIKPKNRLAWTGLITGIIGIGIASFITGTHPGSVASTTATTVQATATTEETVPAAPTQADYEKQSAALDYRKGALKKYDDGTKLFIQGEIVEVDGNTLRIALSKDEYGFPKDQAFAEFSEKPEALEGDVVKIWGDYNETKTFHALSGDKDFPDLSAKFIKVIEAKK